MVAQTLGKMQDKLERMKQKNQRLTEKLKQYVGDDVIDSILNENNGVDSPEEDIDQLLKQLMKGGPKSTYSH